jgi:hypothetical protein
VDGPVDRVEDHIDDLVLGLGRDLIGLLGGFGSLGTHVGTLGESAELESV